MKRLAKVSYIVLLICVSLSASVFMIIESGTFFQELYKNNSLVSFMGYWAAFLNEVFMGIMAAVWIPGKKSDTGIRVRPVNIFFKALLVMLFITTVSGSSMNTIYPLITDIQTQSNHKEVIRILQSQAEDNDRSLNAFVQQNQKANAALSVRNQVRIKEELREVIQKQDSSFALWLEVLVIILIRFGVQLANLSCIWLAGWIYRQPVITRTTSDLSNVITSIHSLNSTTVGLNSSVLDQPKIDQQIQQGNSVIVNKSTHHNRDIHPSLKTSNVARLGGSSNFQKENSFGKRVASPITQKDSSDSVSDIRKKIARLLQSRNEGISLSQVGKAIGEKEADLREIVDLKAKFEPASVPALENILFKIESLYNEEHSQMS